MGGILFLKEKLDNMHMHLTPVNTKYYNLMNNISTFNIFTKDMGNSNRLLDQSVKQFTMRTRSSTIKPECELIQIIIQERDLNSPLISAQEPTLQERNSDINSWKQIDSNFGYGSQVHMHVT